MQHACDQQSSSPPPVRAVRAPFQKHPEVLTSKDETRRRLSTCLTYPPSRTIDLEKRNLMPVGESPPYKFPQRSNLWIIFLESCCLLGFPKSPSTLPHFLFPYCLNFFMILTNSVYTRPLLIRSYSHFTFHIPLEFPLVSHTY